MWRPVLKVTRSLPVRIAAALYVLYLISGFFLVDPLARKLLPWIGDRMLASRLDAQQVRFNPFTLEWRVRGLQLSEPGGEFLAGFDRLYVNMDVTGLTRWAWRIRDIELDAPRGRFELRPGGGTNWNTLLAKLRERSGPPSDKTTRLLIDHARVVGGDIAYIDASRPGEPFTASLKPLDIELEEISTLPKDRGDYLISARLPEQGATLRWKGDVGLNPLLSEGDVALEGARIEQLMRAFESPLNGDAKGTVAAQWHYRFAMVRKDDRTNVPSLALTGAQVQVKDFAIVPRGAREPLLQLADARLMDASFDSLRHELTVGSVKLEGGRLAAARDARGALDWQALFKPKAPRSAPATEATGTAAPWKVAVRDIRLASWSARWRDDTYLHPLSASAERLELAASLKGEFGSSTSLVLGPVTAAVGPLRITSDGKPVAQLERAALTNASVQLPRNRIRADALSFAGVRSAIALDKQQRINWAEILRKRTEAAPGTATEAGAAPDLLISRIAVEDIGLRVTDASTATPVALDLIDGRIALSDVGLDLDRPLPVEAAISVKQGGRLEARGSVEPGKASGKIDLQLAGLSLKPFAPYVNHFARLLLKSGTAGTRGQLSFAPAKSGIGLSYTGGFAVDNLAITEEDTGDAFLGWKKLSSNSVRVSLAPNRLLVGELVAQNPVGKLIIFEDRTLNLQRIRRASAPAPAAQNPTTSPQFPIAIERLRVIGAGAEFADLSLTPQFGTRMHDLGGVVTGLSTDPRSSAQVELDGKVDEYGSVRVRGSIQPFRATESTDLTLAFRNIEMARLSPYSGKFAGRKVDAGRMSADLEYKIKQRQLAGTNKFVINQLKLGERVDSPDALKLPLDLALAVLQDSNGVIDLDLPVSGSLDDPQFSYGAVIWKALANVLTKVVTAPFRALGSLLGIEMEKMEAIVFDPGSQELLPPEQEKLKKLADALARKPTLKLSIEPGYDPEADRRALQEAEMRRQAATVAGLKVAPGTNPGPVDVNNFKIQTWLEDRYAALAGKEDYQKLRASFQDANASGASRVMHSPLVQRLGRQFGTRDNGPPSAFHAELLERLTRRVAIADDALVALAQARAGRLREALVKQGLDAARVAVSAPAPHAAKDGEVACALSLAVGGG